MKLAGMALMLTLGCGSLLHPHSSRTPACVEANDSYRAARASEIVCNVVAGATAAGGTIYVAVDREPWAPVILGGISVLGIACSSLAGFLAGEYAEDAMVECAPAREER